MTASLKAKPVTIRTVATRARVSAATVSRVFGAALAEPGVPVYIKPATERRVRRAAEEVGYFPNAAASRLRRRASRILGVIISDMDESNHSIDPISAMRIGAIEHACSQRGYGLQLMRSTAGDPARLMNWIASRSCDGLFFTGTIEDAWVDACRRLAIPCVDLLGTFGPRKVCTVEIDLIDARLAALRHLASLGHRRIGVACVNSDRQRLICATLFNAAADSVALRDCALTRFDLPHVMAVLDAAPLVASYLAMPEPDRPTAILAHENTLLALLGEMSSRGLSCPRDISLLGLSRTTMSDAAVPRLAGIDNRCQAVCRVAVGMLIDRLEWGATLSPEDSPSPLKCDLVVRDSCAAPR